MNEINKDDIICMLVKAGLFHDSNPKVNDLSETTWEEVYKELKEQTISGLPAEWIFSNVVLPHTLRKKWEEHYLYQVSFFFQLLYAQNELVQLMLVNDIHIAILKGLAAAMYYPQPSMRLMGDIDFLVPEKEFQRAYHLMLNNGYRLIYEEEHVDYHMTLQKDKFIYEIHIKPAGMPEGEEGEHLQELIARGLENIQMARVDMYEVPILPSVQNGVVLLLHIVKHLQSGLGLRQIVDWMMYVNRELHDDNWYNTMQPILMQTQYETLAKIVTRMCQIYLGLEQNNISWCLDVDEDVCAKLMTYIMEQGNFGNKIKEEDKGVKVIWKIKNPIEMLRLLQVRGEENWEVLEEHPRLRVLAWAHTLFRYVDKVLRRKAPIKTLVLDVKKANDRRQLFDELGIYQNE